MKKANDLEMLSAMAAKSKLTEKSALKISKKINKSAIKKFLA